MRARIVAPDVSALAEAASRLSRGEVVGLPTETVYGLAGDATNPEALARIFSVKERPTFDPLIVHVLHSAGSERPLEQLAGAGIIDPSSLDAAARQRIEMLIAAWWPGPLTLVLPRGARIPLLATSGMETVAVRAPSHRVARALLEEFGKPLAAPSANRFGRISPTSAQDVATELGDRLDLILDGGQCELGLESTVLRVEAHGEATLLRPGGISRSAITELLGSPVDELRAGEATPASPGLLASHYAPRKPLHLLTGPLGESAVWRSLSWRGESELPAVVGLLAWSGSALDTQTRAGQSFGRQVVVRVLSEAGEVEEAARNLFAHLRALDASEARLLFAEPCPTREGLGHAIADRLTRAAAKPPT